jgi:hypothetical protein
VFGFQSEIWRMQAVGDVKGLIGALKTNDPDMRKRAITALRTLGAGIAIPPLQTMLLSEHDPELRQIILTALDMLFDQESAAEHQSPDGENKIVKFISRLSGDNVEQAVRAAQGLGESHEKLAIEALIVTFNNRRLAPRVRLAAAEALVKLESAPIEVSLLGALRSDKPNMRRNAAAVLGHIGAEWSTEPLIAALRDAEDEVRTAAYAALERIGTPEALAALDQIDAEEQGETAPEPTPSTTVDAAPPVSAAPAPADSEPLAKADPVDHAASIEPAQLPEVAPTPALTPTPTQVPPAEAEPTALESVIALPDTAPEPPAAALESVIPLPDSPAPPEPPAVDTSLSESSLVIPEPEPDTEEDTRPMQPTALGDSEK